MLLTYVDESGINYNISQNGLFKDGPFLVWLAFLIPEQKYFHLERLFCELVSEKLGVKDWRVSEIHGSNVWAGGSPFEDLLESQKRDYFNELLQLLTKLDIKVIASIKKKQTSLSNQDKSKHKSLARRTLITGIEHELSRLSQTTVIIADKGEDEFGEEVYKRVQWRHNPGAQEYKDPDFKYKYETMSCFVTDSVHFVDSKNALFIQIADQLAFALQRVLTYAWMVNHPTPEASGDKEKVPVSSEVFSFFADRCLRIVFYSALQKDAIFMHQDIYDSYQYLTLGSLTSVE